MDYPDIIRETVEKIIAEEDRLIEQMIEVMLTTPDSPGVAVQHTWEGFSCTTTVSLDLRVPFGTIGYLPDVYR